MRPLRRDVAAVDLPLGDVARQVADRVRVAAPGVRAGRDKELRDPALLQVVADRDVGLGAERVEDREDLILLDELARLRDGLRRVVRVVEVAVIDLPPVHAAAVVDVLEVRLRSERDGLVAGREPAERDRPTEQDRARGDARVGGGRARHDYERGEDEDQGGAHRPIGPTVAAVVRSAGCRRSLLRPPSS